MRDAGAAVWLYGSYARGDYDLHSDVDVLVLGTDRRTHALRGIPGLCKKLRVSFSFYSWEELDVMTSYGSLFLHHLRAEGLPLWQDAQGQQKVRRVFECLPPYQHLRRDILVYRQAVRDTRRSLLKGGPVPFELALLATTLRHAAVLGCYVAGHPNFGRTSAIKAYAKRAGLEAWTSYRVEGLVDYKLWSEGRRRLPEHAWLERAASDLCEEVSTFINAVEGDAVCVGLIAA